VVYRDAAAVTKPGPEVAADPVPPTDGEWSLPVDPTLLFRFSALTYNAHRIHYDRDFARDVEGYPGLVTHGPLQALAMAESVRRTGATATSIDYRFLSPLFGHQGLVASSTGTGPIRTASVRDLAGRVTATGRVAVNQP
jgi:3-methylfumaryl-CoA hydratase